MTAALFAVSAAFLAVGCHWHLEFLDEGSWSYGAWLIAQGVVPYRDFMLIGTPAHLYVLGGLMKLFGPSLMLERAWQCLVWSGVFVLLYVLLRPRVGKWPALASWAMALALVGCFPHLPGPLPSALFFALLCAHFLLKERALPAGAAAAISALFRQDIGSYALAAAAVYSIYKKNPSSLFRSLLAAAGVAVFPAAYFLSQVPFGKLVWQLAGYAATLYPEYGRLPFPAFSARHLAFYFPAATLAIGVLFLVLHWKKMEGPRRDAFFLSVLFAALFLLPLRFRADAPHLISPFIGASWVFSFLLDALFRANRPAMGVLSIVLLSVFAMPSVTAKLQVLRGGHPSMALDVPRARGIEPAPRPGQEAMFSSYGQALEYVRSITSPKEKIFVGSVRHDRVCYGDPLFYFLAERESVSPHHEMHRGVANREGAQREIVEALEKAQVRVVVLRRMLDDHCREPNSSSKTDGSKFLDEYIRRNYRQEKEFSGDSVWVRVAIEQ